jgi:lysophospholipase
LILQAGNDQIVDNKAQHRAIGAMTQLKVIADASHELLIEKDSYRDAALQQFFGFIDCHALAAEIPALTAQ